MEHIDALEAVRRLTLERNALAEQVKRLEDAETGEGRNGAPVAEYTPSWRKIAGTVMYAASEGLQRAIEEADNSKDLEDLARLEKGKRLVDSVRADLRMM